MPTYKSADYKSAEILSNFSPDKYLNHGHASEARGTLHESLTAELLISVPCLLWK